jgi:hypothetical protein
MNVSGLNVSNLDNTIKPNIKIKEHLPVSPHSKKYIHSISNIQRLDSGNYRDSTPLEKTPQHNCECVISKDIIKEYSVLKSLLLLIHEKKVKLVQSKSILEFKYNKYKKCHNFWNIGTILLSSTLTLVESSKLVFIKEDNGLSYIINNFFKLSPILLGTFITCSASIIKFKKYQEQMEGLYIVIDKCIAMIAKLKNKKDEILLLKHKEQQLNIDSTNCDSEEIKKFKQSVETLNETFKNDIIKEFSNVYQETERYINYNDYNKYLKIINNIEFKKHILREDKEKFFNDYEHDMEEGRIYEIVNKTIHEKVKVKNCCGFNH